MQTRTKWYALTIFVWALTLIIDIFTLPLLIYPITGLFWYLVGKKLEPARGLAFFLAVEEKFPRLGRPKENITTTIQSAMGQETGYFFQNEEFPKISSRLLRIFLPTIGLSLWLTSFVPTLDAIHPWVTSVVLAIPLLWVLPFILFPMWIYEDSGLRWYNRPKGTVSIPGRPLNVFLPGIGVILTIASLFGKWTPQLILEFAIALLIFILPVALFGAVVFSYRLEPQLLAKFRRTSVVYGISNGTVTVNRGNIG